MKTNRTLAVIVLCGWACYAALSYGQAPDPGKFSAEQFEVKATRGHKAAMRDGVRLSVDVFQPKADERFPAILIITPYGNNPGYQKRGSWFAQRGYVVAVADSRGRFDSEGVWDPFDPKHKTDGYDLVEWLAAQPWCNGKIGMMGLSYMGWAQWWTATQAPPSLRAIVPEVAPPDQFYNVPYQNGVLVGVMLDWAGANAGRVGQTLCPGPYGGFGASDRRLNDYMQLPYLKLNELRGALDSPWFEKWIRGHVASDPYWRGIAYQTPQSYAKVKVPSLAVTGWFDADFPGSPMNYLAMKKHGATAEARRPRMVIGPWQHIINTSRKLGAFDYGADAVINWDGYVCRWFDHLLKGIANGVTNDPPVHVFVMGRNRWHAEQDWPLPQTRWTKYFLHSGGHEFVPIIVENRLMVESLSGLLQVVKTCFDVVLMLVQGDQEFGQVLVALDASEAFLGHQQRRRSPAHHHPGVPPAFDPARPALGPGKTAFNQVGRGEAAAERLV